MQDKIVIRGAREHNLKNISLELPRNKMIVFTGLSGSGKSSLAFDTIFAEGQRRYIESLSAYARQFLGNMTKPDVDEILGLSPAISIDQKAHSANPRSTVATITEIYDYLRVLYARVGKPHCPVCDTKIEKMTTDEITERIIERVRTTKHTNIRKTAKTDIRKSELFENQNIIKILSPVVRGRKGEYYQMLYDMYNSGFLEVRVDGKMKSLREQIKLSKNNKHTIEIVVDKIDYGQQTTDNSKKKVDSSPSSDDDTRVAEAVETAVDLSNGLCTVIYSDDDEQVFSTEYSCPNDGYSFPEIEPRMFSFNSPYGYCAACTGLGTRELFSEELCPVCEGKRLNENALAVKIDNKNIWEVTGLTIEEGKLFFEGLFDVLNSRDLDIASAALNEITNRLQFLFNVGLHYLTLNRTAGTLSGGEAQRIRLASQVGQQLVGALYVLDEPTIGLHQRDNDLLVSTLRNLCDIGNTIIIVEHDEDTILVSDWVVDIGPGAGKHGGHVVYSGPRKTLLETSKSKLSSSKESEFPNVKTLGSAEKSLTGQYLRGEKKIDVPTTRRKVDSSTPKLKITGASENNLKNLTVEVPLRRMVCLTGVSGSGKSTLMHDIIYRAVANKLNHVDKRIGVHKAIKGIEYIDKIIQIDQNPIGRTPRSNPATYTKAYDAIRDLFTMTAEARIRGYKKGRFSFNRPGGRCENCEGKGVLNIEMHFLPSVEIVCDVCNGKRFNAETLQVHYAGKNISDVLNMTVEDAEDFFQDIPPIHDKIKMLKEVGLDYLTLGQSATTLSGGEAQRIKLSRELAKRNTTKTLYLLDEPTTGLHYDDVKKLIEVIQRLVSQGNTVMIIEHNLDLIKCADWIIDLGPEGGDKGGSLVATGTPEEVARKSTQSHTGAYLKKYV
ncbi:MAG: excinuclease ABC subunit A [Candidatus Magasanikbacteria bacterium CG_4_9_14_0_2_um_filter_42_11]|uniref:UvrABC system protein A n=1 Tax=Candidatus Magasanikbacteria bacterium CG_4_9_14_0_2_um_filter_42_11 TaxID=1974643 RepID=A0A2M8F8B1_9BACT|nr:MAG: excinuclease ABC subunit A [Candidatus Magasanikbacteria bacterium CG10_big_fil_rev_8_21_14_0_10_43_9]PIY92818.1 MAG: excinuclease ABC subunit A [Candidatus Magasanikbacteria bacterium CG_4_10_14_0_8_um_filter_42_12]PJC51970.1 MAG: excinuclease ABC subunit A [Candidatus Magasanikbacteria bacterium CG_4_9_14_0_2_um_filter_42_11]